jgi:hypothetical protein
MTGYEWYVDYNKVLHYFAPEEEVAPFALSDNPDNSSTYPYYDFSRAIDATRIANRVLVIGGYYRSDDTEFILEANGVETIIPLPYKKVHAPTTNPTRIQVWKNTGDDVTPVWVEQTVGLDNMDSLADYDCLFNFGDSLLKFASAPAELKKSVKIKGRYVVPVVAQLRSDSSYVHYGRWYDKKIVDKDISSKEEAKDRAKAILSEQAFAKEIVRLRCMQPGLCSGQRLRLIHSILGIDRYYTIAKVRTIVMRGDHAEYIVEMAGSHPNPDIIDNLVELNRKVDHSEIRDDEILNEYFELIESLTSDDGTPTATATGPRYYVSPATSGDPIKAGFWKCSA